MVWSVKNKNCYGEPPRLYRRLIYLSQAASPNTNYPWGYGRVFRYDLPYA